MEEISIYFDHLLMEPSKSLEYSHSHDADMEKKEVM